MRLLVAISLLILCCAAAFAAGSPPRLDIRADNPKIIKTVREGVTRLAPALNAITGAAPDSLRIVVAPSKAEFDQLARQLGMQTWAAGLALPGRDMIILRSPGQLIDPGEFDILLAHELTHIYLAGALGHRRAPLWLEEGIAMWASGDSSLGRTWTMSKAVLMNELIPFGKLTNSFPAQREQASLAYAQSYYFVAYIVDNYGAQAITSMLKGISQGKDLSGVVHSFAGVGLWGLEQEFIKSSGSRFSWLMVFTGGGTLWGLIAIFAAVGLVHRRRKQLQIMRDMPDYEEEEAEPLSLARKWPPPRQLRSALNEAGLEQKKKA